MIINKKMYLQNTICSIWEPDIVKKHYMSAEQYKSVLIYTHICRAYTETSSFIILFFKLVHNKPEKQVTHNWTVTVLSHGVNKLHQISLAL